MFNQQSGTSEIRVQYNTQNTAYEDTGSGTLVLGSTANSYVVYSLAAQSTIPCQSKTVLTLTSNEVLESLVGNTIKVQVPMTGIDFSGSTVLGNPPTVNKSKSNTYSIGCKTAGNCAYGNYQFHHESFCITANAGCTDGAAINWSAAYTTDCDGNCIVSGVGGNLDCCCYDTPVVPNANFLSSANISLQQGTDWRLNVVQDGNYTEPCYAEIGVYVVLYDGVTNYIDASSIIWLDYDSAAATNTTYSFDITPFGMQQGQAYDKWVLVRNQVGGSIMEIYTGQQTA
jgi:hypothetical protein